MTIGIDISQIVYTGTGVARFTDGLVREILRDGRGHHWHFVYYAFRRQPDPALIGAIRSAGYGVTAIPLPPTIMEIAWNRLRIPAVTALVPGLDWFLTSDWTEPPAACRKATIVHDLVFKRYPETVNTKIRAVMKRRLALVAHESDIIFCDSETTRTDLHKHYTITPEKTIVNFPGLTPLPEPKQSLEAVLKAYNLTPPYYLAVGKREPRKNLERLVAAYEKLDPVNGPPGSRSTQLVIAGDNGWGKEQVNLPPDIHFLGFVPDEDLTALYRGSLGLVFPSLYEGFGYPAVEAMSLGVPVALSDTSSLAEIGANIALKFDPYSVDAIADALRQLQDPIIRKRLATAGPKRAAEFSWQRYANTLVSTLQAAA
ncbi:MAG: glycosyltransferase family 4 protein [Patescibacteria group bacterium]|nr:glycosyltransferase family 4 protein [Patescibacteria group bacterium]